MKNLLQLCATMVVAVCLVSCEQSQANLSATHPKPNSAKKPSQKPLTAAESKAVREKWEASPDGIRLQEWKASSIGKKVLAAAANIQNEVRDSTIMEAVVTDLSLPPGARLGFGVMVQIHGEAYIMNFGSAKPAELNQLHSLKEGDKIRIRSHFVSYAPKYDYPIVAGNYVERDHKILFKAAPQKDGC